MKKEMLALLLLMISLIHSPYIFGQGVIKGSLIDEQNNAIPFATVVLKNTNDSSFYQGELSNEKGIFIFEKIKEGYYFAEIKFFGYRTTEKTNIIISAENPTQDLGTIPLSPDIQSFKTVTILGDKPFIEKLPDRTVVNIDQSIIFSGSSALQIMEKLPGVQIDQEGSISLQGKKGVSVMIDEKPTVLTEQGLANLLRSMSSSNIQKMEIITNPSAKYDAAGNSGIINIVTKKNKKEGFNGSAHASYGQGRYDKGNLGFDLSFKGKKHNLFMNYNYARDHVFNAFLLTQNFLNSGVLNSVFKTKDDMVWDDNNSKINVGEDFYLTKKTTLSLLATGAIDPYFVSTKSHSDFLDKEENKVSSSNLKNYSVEQDANYALSARLKHQLDSTGREITADLDYLNYRGQSTQKYSIINYDSQDNFINESLSSGTLDGNLKIYSVKADYTHPLKSQAKFDAGVKSSYVSTDNDVKFYHNISNVLLFDTGRSSHFIYSENINAAYVSYNKEFKKLSFQLGLRSEQTISNGNQIINDQKFKKKYIQLFPSAFIDYKLTDKQDLNLKLGRRIDRPSYDQLNPFLRIIDAYYYYGGNPHLLPQLAYNFELTYSCNNIFFTTLGFSQTRNNITFLFVVDDMTKNSISTFANLSELNYYKLNLTYSKRLTKWWTTNTSLLVYYAIYTGKFGDYYINQGEPSFIFSTNNSFTIVDGFSAEAGFNYNYRNLEGVSLNRTANNLTLGIQKSLFNQRASIVLSVSDILYSSYMGAAITYKNSYGTWVSKRDSRAVTLSFTYRFGKGKAAEMLNHSGADDEKGRVGY